MKVCIAQLNYHLGNFESNFSKIKNAIIHAKEQKADLIVFSELAICGYYPIDLLEKKTFVENCDKYLKKIIDLSNNIGIIIGLPTINPSERGKKLFNSAAFIFNGELKKLVHKTLLPTYDIFDEYRHFEPNNVFELIEFNGEKIAITICEDIWDEQKVYGDFGKKTIYNNNPFDILAKLNPDFVINISASPFSYNQVNNRRNVLLDKSIKYSLPILYVNQVGANTDLIFDGGSLAVNSKRQIVLECKYFEEDIQIIDTSLFNSYLEVSGNRNRIEDIYSALTLGIKDYFAKSGFSKAVLGLSGGIDSAVTLAIAVDALGHENVMSILMPAKYSSDHSINDSIEMLKRTSSPYQIVNIENIRLELLNTLNEVFIGTKEDITEENIQARIRGTILMAFSNKFGNILLNTSNKSEFAVGYSTLYGDMNGALSILGDVYKTDVYKLANFINEKHNNIIPQNIINKAPSAELRPNQKDEDSLPPYEILDKILFSYIEKKLSKEEILGFDEETVNYVIKLVNNSEFKRFQAAPILRISSKAFGQGRKFPIVAKY
ncbi:MAG: NAD+ synthase [Bacteroidales bacterium]|jgi:NAD+ synthase (glutamine-hydrolysing)|nr:NAD+ synthase [Bacteroidales bacterium]